MANVPGNPSHKAVAHTDAGMNDPIIKTEAKARNPLPRHSVGKLEKRKYSVDYKRAHHGWALLSPLRQIGKLSLLVFKQNFMSSKSFIFINKIHIQSNMLT